jgi:hypothetical protein
MSNFSELAKILAHEQSKGCNNSSVIGGVEKFVENWARRTRTAENEAGVTEIVQALAGYAQADIAARKTMIQQAVSAARQFETRENVGSCPRTGPRRRRR